MARLPSRLARFEEKKLKNRLIYTIIGLLLVLTFFAVFGFKLFIGFFVFLDQMRGNESPKTVENQLLVAPFLDSVPIATNSSKFVFQGKAQSNNSVVLFIDSEETKKTKADTDGMYVFENVTIPEGTHIIQTKTTNDKGKFSEFSNKITTTVKKKQPKLDVATPTDNSTIRGEDPTLIIEGKTDPDVNIRINDRFVVVKSDGSFSYSYQLSEGDTELTIVAIDLAGNEKQVKRAVTYHKE